MSAKKVVPKKATKKATKKAVSKKLPLKKASQKKAVTKKLTAQKKVVRKGNILSAPQVSEAFASASSFLSDTDKLRRLVSAGVEKIGMIKPDAFRENWAYLTAMVRLLSAYRKGHYREIPWKSLVSIGGAVLYVVNPFDLIPDGILIVGLTDDAAVVDLALKVVKDDLDKFMAWETTR